jgi:hypothetical protein
MMQLQENVPEICTTFQINVKLAISSFIRTHTKTFGNINPQHSSIGKTIAKQYIYIVLV